MIQAMIAEGVSSMGIGLGPALTQALSTHRSEAKLTTEAGRAVSHNRGYTNEQIVQTLDTDTDGDDSEDIGRGTNSRLVTTDAAVYFQAARIYSSNSGSLRADSDTDLADNTASTSTSCYASDIANRLLGWNGLTDGCTLD